MKSKVIGLGDKGLSKNLTIASCLLAAGVSCGTTNLVFAQTSIETACPNNKTDLESTIDAISAVFGGSQQPSQCERNFVSRLKKQTADASYIDQKLTDSEFRQGSTSSARDHVIQNTWGPLEQTLNDTEFTLFEDRKLRTAPALPTLEGFNTRSQTD